MDKYQGVERRALCDNHERMLEHDEAVSVELAKVDTKLRLGLWIASAMFLAALGSVGALLSVSYHFGVLAQRVEHSTAQIEELKSIVKEKRRHEGS